MALPQLIVDSIQLRVRITWGGREQLMYGVVAMWPYWLGFLAFIYCWPRRVRYKAPLHLYIAAMMCGLAVLAKGLAGLGLPVIMFVAYLAFTWNWRRLRAGAAAVGGADVAAGAAWWSRSPGTTPCSCATAAPFWNELFGDNHWRRMVLGRHGDRGSFEYFMRELGYALLPWIAMAPAALGAAVCGACAARTAARTRPNAPAGDVLAGRHLVRGRRTRWCRCR